MQFLCILLPFRIVLILYFCGGFLCIFVAMQFLCYFGVLRTVQEKNFLTQKLTYPPNLTDFQKQIHFRNVF